jgi:hypothetical protein
MVDTIPTNNTAQVLQSHTTGINEGDYISICCGTYTHAEEYLTTLYQLQLLYKIKQTMKAMMFMNGEEDYVEMEADFVYCVLEITSSVT